MGLEKPAKHISYKVAENTSYKWGYNSSSPFIPPFIGAPQPHLQLVGAHLVRVKLLVYIRWFPRLKRTNPS